MQSNLHPFKSLNTTPFNLETTSSKMDLAKVMNYNEFNEFTLFIAHFNALPNFISEKEIDCKRANKWFVKHFNADIKDYYFKKTYLNNSGIAELDDIFYFLYEDLIVDFDTNNSFVRFLFKKTQIEKIEPIIRRIKNFRKTKEAPKISLLVSSKTGIETKALVISKPKLNICDNYNEDFLTVHHSIIKRLSQKNDKGLVLLHGKPGTGKTSYIRYLISAVKKNVIFLPPNMAEAITDPNLIQVLIANPNSIFVIEDAENIITDREVNGTSPVSALLNISDGLLADCLNIQIICSFNTDISKVDSALLRKGRLIAKYEFRELTTNKAQALSNKLGFSTIIDAPSALTAIYNQEERDLPILTKCNAIGFKTTFSN